jgi:hypothetical protein
VQGIRSDSLAASFQVAESAESIRLLLSQIVNEPRARGQVQALLACSRLQHGSQRHSDINIAIRPGAFGIIVAQVNREVNGRLESQQNWNPT